MTNPMSKDDLEAIKWLEEQSLKNESISNAWKILKAYFTECLNELQNITYNKDLFSSETEKRRMYKLALEKLNNYSFSEECEAFLKQDINSIKQTISYQNENSDLMVVKICRLYNMRLKLGHSARITYIANNELDAMIKESNNKNIEVLRNTVVLSALLHDIGRFYQAAKYNNLNDNVMIQNEPKIGSLDVDHAIAGYYYSVATALELHKLLDEKDEQLKHKFIEEAIAATVVKFHQRPNSEISHFDYNGDISILNNSNLDDVYNFINKAYDHSEIMNNPLKINDEKHQEFINKFIKKIKKIIKSKKIDYTVASGFNYNSSFVDNLYKELSDKITSIINKSNIQNVEEVSEEIVNVMNNKVKELTNETLNKKEENKVRKEIITLLNGMLSFDVSESISELLKENKNIKDIVKFMISSSVSMTMDADKIDILNQRALGIYNTSYIMESYEIFPVENKSLKQILNEYFKFNINDDKVVLDQKIINTINCMSNEVKEGLNTYLSEFNLFENGKIKDDIQIAFTKDKVVLKENNEEKVFNSDKLYKVFNHEWISFICQNCNFEQLPFKEFKDKYFGKAQISITKDDLEDNTKSLTSQEKLNTYKRLVVTPGLKERFMKEGNNKKGSGWIKQIDSDDSNHLVTSSISGLLWQLNQFLFTNMRNIHSYEFIEKYKMLDDIYERFYEKSPITAEIIKEYIDYCKFFINNLLNKKNTDILTKDEIDIIRKETYEKFINNEENFVKS